MARKHAAAPPKSKSSPTLIGIGFKAGLTVLIGIGLLAGLVWLGQHAGQAVATQPKYQVPLASVQFDPPLGVDRTAFLAEVRSLGELPETISAVAAETPPMLAAAFAKHPWVAEVKRVHVDPDRTIHVEMIYRTPVLAVKLTGEPTLRMVDKTGTLLPISPVPDLLAVLNGEMKSNDATLKRAAEIVDMLKDKKPRKIEKTNTGWRVTPESGAALNVAW